MSLVQEGEDVDPAPTTIPQPPTPEPKEPKGASSLVFTTAVAVGTAALALF